MRTLKSTLKKWTEIDIAAFELGVVLGLMPDDVEPFPESFKHVFWSSHDVGDALTGFLLNLVDAGVLERNLEDGNDQVRWNSSFKGSWED